MTKWLDATKIMWLSYKVITGIPVYFVYWKRHWCKCFGLLL